MSAFSRSWDLTKLSFGVIAKDKELLLFPLIAVILSVGYLLALLYPTILLEMARDGSVEWSVADVIVAFLCYLGLAFIGTFSNMCIVYTAKKRFEGGDASFGESIGFTLRRLHQVLGWATVSATVGTIFYVIDSAAERMGGVGRIVASILRGILGAAWAVVTLFVIPSMVYRGTGPIDAIKDSLRVLKQTWGESLVRSVGFGLIQFALLFVGGLAFGALAVPAAQAGATAIVALVGVAAVYFTGVVFVFLLARMIFNTALYAYASQGTIAPGYDRDLLGAAFRSK